MSVFVLCITVSQRERLVYRDISAVLMVEGESTEYQE
jgi:hypothetical protein